MTAEAGPVVEIRPVDDFASLAPTWLDLEARADGSFFQSWAWTGCLAEERFDAPWLLSARRGERVVALALFNRGRRRGLDPRRPLLLGESGAQGRDSIFIEHNGLLVDRSEPASLRARCWTELATAKPGRGTWISSGVPTSLSHDLPPTRSVRTLAHRPAPYLDFGRIDPGAEEVLGALSPNTRQQLRRSLRAWQAMGPLQLDLAEAPDQADVFLDGLKNLHQLYWVGRGKPGAFAEPFFERFHRALIRRAAAGQRIDLIRISAGSRVVGYLYNFVHRGAVAAYQSGFDFGDDADRLRPGLVCHLLAIERYRREGMRFYDFLGGDARYKRSFANGEAELVWLAARPRLWSRAARASEQKIEGSGRAARASE